MNILLQAAPFMPPQASTVAGEVDALYGFIFWLSVVFFILVIGPMVYFVWKYRQHGEEIRPVAWITHNLPLELAWSIIPLILVIIIAVWGFWSYMNLYVEPPNAEEIQVVGFKWGWKFEHRDGIKELGELHVEVNKPIKLVMTSMEDNENSTPVIHSFFVPDFRVKQDLPPGRYTTLWFTPTVLGEHQVYCTEYCGDSHSAMLAKLYVLTPEEMAKFRENGGLTGPPTAELGKDLYTKRGCATCHSVDGSRLVGPSFKGIWDSMQPLQGAPPVKVDENFLRESILNPNAKIAEGYPPVMNSYQGILRDPEIQALILYIKSLK
ncbi:MAG TPA: cytochrome c oxidase subunit II [Blastocatellia bacterium]|nr:cytochrome c oxidase subunit II [Blastocatellia bacterium]